MSNWDVCRIDDLGTVNRGKSKHRPRNDSILFGGSYPFIQTADVKKANLYITEYDTTYSDIGLAQSKLWDKGTLCITIAANIAESAILGIDACFPDSVVGFIPHKGKADLKFVKYLLDEFKVYMQQISKGTTQDNLSLDKLRRVKFNVPDYEKQVKIANTLSTYDDLIENNNKRIKLLEQMSENLYKEWFVRFRFPGYKTAEFENGLPKGWKIKKIGKDNLLPIITGKKDANYGDDGGEYTFFTCAQKEILAPDYSFDQSAIILAGNGDLSVKLFKGKFEAYQRVYVLTPYNLDYLNILYYVIKDELKTLTQGASGSTIRFITKGMIERISTVIPNEDILRQFNEIIDDIYEQKTLLEKANNNLIKQRDLLLPRLMSGKLEV